MNGPADLAGRHVAGLVVAWGLIDGAMGVYLGQNGTSVLTTLLLAGGVVTFVVAVLGPGSTVRNNAIENLLLVLLLGHTAIRIVVPYRPEPPRPEIGIEALALVATASAFVALWRWRRPAVASIALVVVIATGLAGRTAIVLADVPAIFDVWAIQDAAGAAVLALRNPYETQVWPHGYPYWPGAAVMAALGRLAGDVRWASIVADGLVALGMVVIAGSVGRPRRLGALAGALLLWSSSGFYMTWQAFPEPGVIAFAVGAALAFSAAPSRPALAGAMAAVSATVKQFGLGLLAWLPSVGRPFGWRAAAAGAVTFAALILPFLLADPTRFLDGTFFALLREPARDYAINLLEPLPGFLPRAAPPFAVVAGIALALAAAVHLRWPPSVSRWLAASATLLLVVYALSGISFVNYFQIVLASMLLVALIERHPSMETVDP